MERTALILLEEIRVVVDSLPSATAALFLADWPAPEITRVVTPSTLPVLAWLQQAASYAPSGPLAGLAQSVSGAAATMAWRQTYRPGEMTAGFLDRYGWSEVFGLKGPVAAEKIAGGFLLLGPDTVYPSHAHVAEELYVPLSGSAEWQVGDSPFRQREPGSAIWHGSGAAHAMRTANAPLLALYLWRGSGLEQSAQVVGSAAPVTPP
jgi:mannose-6-phosphate isomerase-like protein (cupin superfamily)